jgi:hypothetical protein
MGVLADGAIVVGDGTTDPVALTAFTSSTGTLKHESGGLEFDASAITTGGIIRGSAAGTMAILTLGTAGQILGSSGGQLAYIATTSIPLAGSVGGTLSATALNTDAVDTITEIAAALKDGSGDCASGLICLGDHTHSGYLLDAGDTGTGTYDFGGATSFEIPNGAAPTMSAIGQIALDTTDNQLLIGTSTVNDPAIIPTTVKLFGGGISSTSPDFISGGRIPLTPQRDGFIVKEIWCLADGGTSVVINLSNLAGTTDSDTVTCDADGQSDTAMSQNATYAAGGVQSIEIGTVTGTVDYITYAIYGTWIRE